ncbi:hypothetical protein LINPERHAP1_LOCUS5778, partial [Linum perenne]
RKCQQLLYIFHPTTILILKSHNLVEGSSTNHCPMKVLSNSART